jgi:hypothetical protein
MSKGFLMPASKALFILLVVGGGAAFGVFYTVPSARPDWVNDLFLKAGGYTPAQSPDEALEKFRTLIKKRDYNTAKLYCSGDYLEQLKIGGPAANKLGMAIDSLLYTFRNTKNMRSDKAEFALVMLDPFPTNFKVEDLKKYGEDKASAILAFDYGRPLQPGNMADWMVDPNIWMALVPTHTRVLVDLKKEGTGKDKAWKIYFPVPPEIRGRVTTLKDFHGNFVAALNQLNTRLKNDAFTMDNFERELKTELEAAKK